MPSPVSELRDDRLADRGVRVLLKRDDLIHPQIPGNKWRKLKYKLAAAREQGSSTLLTFGGAYSNHIRATAAVGYYGGFDTIGVIRGEEHLPLNPSLRYASQHGMRLTYLDRASYRAKTSDTVIDGLHRAFGDFYLLPEGGSNSAAVLGYAGRRIPRGRGRRTQPQTRLRYSRRVVGEAVSTHWSSQTSLATLNCRSTPTQRPVIALPIGSMTS